MSRKIMFISIILLFTVTSFFSCNKSKARKTKLAVKQNKIAKLNENMPKKGNWDFDLKKEWAIEGNKENGPSRIDVFRVNNDGKVYILDSKSKKIFVYSTEGKLISSIGENVLSEKCERPYDFFLSEKFVIVKDIGYWIHFFSKNGKFQKSYSIDRTLVPRFFIDNNRYFSIRSDIEKDDKKVIVELFNLNKNSSSIIDEFDPETYLEASDGEGQGSATFKIQFPGITDQVIASYNNNTLCYGKSDSYMFNVVDLKSRKTLSFSIKDRKKKLINIKDTNYIINAFKSLPQEIQEQLKKSIPDYFTYFKSIKIDENGFIYVFLSGFGGESGELVDIFSKDGIYLYKSNIKLAEGVSLEQDLEIVKNNIFCLVKDKNKNYKLIKYKIKKPIKS